MSTSTDLYDKIRAAIPTLTGFNTKTEIPYPYSLEDNNINLLRDGWGIRIGPSSPDTETDYPQYTVIQEYEVVLARIHVSTASNADPLVTVTKELMDDIATIQDDFTGSRFSIADKVEYVDVVSISSVDNVTSGKFNHIVISITFGITHWK